MHVEQIEPQRVHADEEARKRHRRRTVHRLHRDPVNAHREWDANRVVEECPEQILVDVADRLPAHADRRRHIRQVALHQDHIRRIDRNVRARPDGDADIRAGERRCIVDAVPDHRNLAIFLQFADDRLFAVR